MNAKDALESAWDVISILGPPEEVDFTANTVHDESPQRVWHKNPGLLSPEQARASGDEMLRAFTEQLGDRFEICDLREAEVSSGFSWGQAGPNAEVRRFGDAVLFAIDKEESMLRRGLGGK